MKKFILFLGLSIFGMSNAQYILWEDEFDGTQTQPWTFHSLDSNPYTWNTGKNWIFTGSSMANGTLDILYYRPYNSTGSYNIATPQNDWAVSPMIDLTGASGIITLAIKFQNDLLDPSNALPVYISTTPDVQVIKDSVPFATISFNKPSFTVQFQEKTTDISSFAGQQIYIAFGKKKTSGNVDSASEIDYVTIVSDTSLATSEVNTSKKTLTTVMQNPVTASLQLQLNPAFKANNTMVSVYNMTGQQVLTAKYAKEINVTELSSGNYIATVSDGSSTDKIKFIKK